MDLKCCICLEKLEFSKNNVSVTHCGRMYHQHCLQEALQVRNSCPQCRRNIDTDKIVFTLFSSFDDKLVYSGSSTETKVMIEKVESHEKEIKMAYIKRISNLERDKEELKRTCESLEKKLAVSKSLLNLQLNNSMF